MGCHTVTGNGMTWKIHTTIAAKIGFATHQNAIPVIRELSLTAPTDIALENLTLSLTADPPFIHPQTWRIDAVAAGASLRIANRDIALNATLLHDLTESLVGNFTLTLRDLAGETLVEHTQPVELLAHNHWGGYGTMAELLAAL